MRRDEVQVWRASTDDGWRWRYVSGDNGKTLAQGEAYHNLADLLSTVRRVTGTGARRWRRVTVRQV